MRMLAAFALLLAAGPVTAQSDAPIVDVRLTNFDFTPKTIELARGRSYALRLTNTSGGGHSFGAKAFFAAESLGIEEKSHLAVYQAIHLKHSIPAEGDPPDEAKVAAFYTQYGVSAEQFLNTMKSFAVSGRINKANQFMARSKVEGTPTLIVNGKYLIKGRSWDDMLRIADHLIAKERAAPSGAAK